MYCGNKLTELLEVLLQDCPPADRRERRCYCFMHIHVGVKVINLCVSEGRLDSYSLLGGRSLRG